MLQGSRGGLTVPVLEQASRHTPDSIPTRPWTFSPHGKLSPPPGTCRVAILRSCNLGVHLPGCHLAIFLCRTAHLQSLGTKWANLRPHLAKHKRRSLVFWKSPMPVPPLVWGVSHFGWFCVGQALRELECHETRYLFAPA